MTKKIKPKDYWQKKRDEVKDVPKVVKIEGKMTKKWGTGTCAIPSPIEVNGYMKSVPKGKVTTINDIREVVAKKHKATMGCPITTGIFAWISANAAEEERREGKKRITPYWRTLKEGGKLNPKYPGGISGQSRQLRSEGHTIKKGRGKDSAKVDDFENKKADLK
ncbi:MGMT family protein [Patescibacteria group bacterium]|nr:MGMT family protein [Patescibacteria group bacterium]